MNTEITQKMLLVRIHILQKSLKEFIDKPIEDNQIYLNNLKHASITHYQSLRKDIMLYNTMRLNHIKAVIGFSYGLVTDYQNNDFVFTPDKVIKDLITRNGHKVLKMTELYPEQEDPDYYMECIINCTKYVRKNKTEIYPRTMTIKYDPRSVPTPNDSGFDLFIIKERE